MLYDILERKQSFLNYKDKELKKSKNLDFSKGVSPWFWSKNQKFTIFLFFCKMGQENVFDDILEREKLL